MINDTLYIEQSLTNLLFYLRTLRDYALNIELSFSNNNQDLIETARDFRIRAEDLLEKTISISQNKIFQEIIDSQIFLTPYTLEVELLTEKLFGVDINTSLTQEEEKLVGNNQYKADQATVVALEPINQEALRLAENFISFLQFVLDSMLEKRVFSYSYPTFYQYMILQITLFKSELERLIQQTNVEPTYITGLQYGNLEAMKRQTQFIYGLSDPNQVGITTQAKKFEEEYDTLIEKYKEGNISPDNQKVFNEEALNVTERFQAYVSSILEQVLEKDTYFIVEPLFLNNLLTDIYYFIYLLKGSYLGILR